ncbi:zinc-binding dehydrogenase [Nonomuraea sp. NPDC049695]|uniref:zinc-binding dehydrogenase n=1 Tax=Nonomuraea sp. NPDC049695 TaxID=3154734 RepID=UPI0034481C8F
MVNFPDYAAVYAEYVVARPRHLARKPAGIDHVQAAALPMPALTALQAFSDIVEISPGQRVLVHAAAGGVGPMGKGQDYPLRSLRVLRPGGTYIAGSGISPEDRAAYDRAGMRYGLFSVEPDHAALAEIAALAADGRLVAHVDRVFPLADAAKAHAVMEGGDFIGKLVLSVAG